MIRGLEKIKSKEEYDAVKSGLEYYIKEYIWLKKCDNPIAEVESEIKSCINKLRKDMDEKEELELLRRIHLLKAKYIAIRENKYENDLKRNISADFLRVEQYDASQEKTTFMSIISGLLKNDTDIKNYLKRKYMLTISNAYGVIPTAVDLNLEKVEDILKYISDNYNLAGINELETSSKDLIIAHEKDKPGVRQVLEMTEEYINEIDGDVLTEADKEKKKKKRGEQTKKEQDSIIQPNMEKEQRKEEKEI